MTNMNNATQDQTQVLNQLRKELRRTRIFCGISSLLTLLLLVGGFLIVTKAQSSVAEITPVVEELEQLDVEEFNRTAANVNATLESVDWEKLSVTLSELDVEALNDAIADLDTEELSEALKNLNDAADTIEGLNEKLEPLTSMFKK